ncbi:hypothetical protein E3N88_20092 [Mikania micrantha]|uniref:Uncharacterized protein n=1 Tax=Mikania micrantha TaxID=192012 RepID=A0A5N6NH81_9ASTR|nr:hypothetical protein E3N88_20092 [Mikania micrantha]
MKCKTLDRGRGGNVVLAAAVGQNLSTAVKGAAFAYDVKESCGNTGLPTVCRQLMESYACFEKGDQEGSWHMMKTTPGIDWLYYMTVRRVVYV